MYLTIYVNFDQINESQTFYKIQGDSFDSTSGKGLLWAYLGCSEGPNSFFVTPRLGAKKVTLNWQKMKLAYNELWIIYKKKDEIYWIRVY